jgi:hypothetical protein
VTEWLAVLPILIAVIVIISLVKKSSHKLVLIIFGGIPLLFVSLVITLVLFISMDFVIHPYPKASTYFSLNAAIKNTCYLDPKMEHCPKNLSDLIAIEPQNFTKFLYSTHLTYVYYPETNTYTLIVNYRGDKAVIFDPRLKNINESGFDFSEVDVSNCGQTHIVNPPSFPGPWNNID